MADKRMEPPQDCPRCGEQMELYSEPRMKELFRVPFTNYTIVAVDYGHAEYRCNCKDEFWNRMEHDQAVDARIGNLIDRGILTYRR